MTNILWSTAPVGGFLVIVVVSIGVIAAASLFRWIISGSGSEQEEE